MFQADNTYPNVPMCVRVFCELAFSGMLDSFVKDHEVLYWFR